MLWHHNALLYQLSLSEYSIVCHHFGGRQLSKSLEFYRCSMSHICAKTSLMQRRLSALTEPLLNTSLTKHPLKVRDNVKFQPLTSSVYELDLKKEPQIKGKENYMQVDAVIQIDCRAWEIDPVAQVKQNLGKQC